MHSRKSGLSDQLALDEYDAIKKAREFIGKEYSEDQERDTIVAAWSQIVDI